MSWQRSSAQRPLRLWGAALRRARARRTSRIRILIAGAIAAVPALATLALLPIQPRLYWNASSSAPVGLYVVQPGAALERGDMVVAWAPEPGRSLAAGRHYLPHNVPLVKRIVAAKGDLICGKSSTVLVNGHVVARRLRHDSRQRPLPHWQGCHRLADTHYFLLMPGRDSFDGRYFGLTERELIVGRARAIWTR